ncbi:hypothetical protein SDC9_175287 [bioreactor metagenome]|uniref:LysR substrate-binding domain-containing protein n=1 Tax=bioreactor metagenome TaxID=1076179 RepID=A0A645GW25_9ZZZZ
MSAEHPLAKNEFLDVKKLKEKYIEIVHGDNVVPYLPAPEIKQNAFTNDYLHKKIYLYERGSQLELLTKVKNTFMLVSPIPKKLLERYNLVQRKCEIVNNSFKDVLIYPIGYKLKPADRMFLNKLYEVKNDVAFIEYK